MVQLYYTTGIQCTILMVQYWMTDLPARTRRRCPCRGGCQRNSEHGTGRQTQLGSARHDEPMKLAAAVLASLSGLSMAQEPQQLVWGDTLFAVVDEYISPTSSTGPAGTTTYRLSVNLKDNVDVASVYKIYGSATSPLSIPAAYQAPSDFGSNVGGASPAFFSVANNDALGYAEYDSFLSVGITDSDMTAALTSTGINWAAWTDSSSLSVTTAGSVSWANTANSLNQPSTTTDPIVVAQLTVPTGTSASVTMGVEGCSTAGCTGSDAWMADGVTFSIGLVCTGVANADANTLTCTAATDSQVTACAVGFNLCESGGTDACVDGTTPDASADTCVPNPTCDVLSCPSGDVLKPDASSIACAGATCTAVECCNPTCGDVDNAFPLSSCAAGMVLKSNLLTVGCPTGTCTSENCCEAAPLICTAVANADANTLTCTAATDSQVTACVVGFNLCESGGTDACVDGTTPDASADTCVPNPTCGNVDDDDDGGSAGDDAFTCHDGDVLKPDPNSITCAEASCTAVECCNPSCGDARQETHLHATEDADAFALSDCADGLVLRSNPLTIGCPTGTCTSNDCCEVAPPSPATPATAATSRAARLSTVVAMVTLVVVVIVTL
eukprot:COSAG02_NODE_656_length_18809_cov_17.805077_8_plen_613_part_00